jgi:error-prone DNA polymerase
MEELFRDRRDAVHQTRVIAERCEFTLGDLGYRFPDFPVPEGETKDSVLRELTYAGAGERYRPITAKVRAQLDRELALIAKLDLAGYFLIVWDISRFARDRNIFAQGRGSAANSAVCYALGITAVDPVGMELLFERFLSEERGEWPDIDIDLPSGDQRETVIQYVYGKYGLYGAAMTANVITYRDRSAVREVGKALGFSLTQVDRVAKLCGRWSQVDDPEFLTERLRSAGLDPEERRVRTWIEQTGHILNLPRHLGQHSGGMVIAAGRLDEVTPIEPATMPGRTVIQWDKDDCAGLKIIKVDLLGLGMLAALEEAASLIRNTEAVEIDYARIPKDDPGVYDMLCRADTVGVFQVESRAQMATLPRLKPRHFYDLVIEIALIRPGPITGNMVHPYLRRRRGAEPVIYPDPTLEPILERTLGVPIFQEQLMRMAMAVAGFSGGEAEELRRAMGFKRAGDRMQEIEGRLRAGMTARGISREAQDQITASIVSFASYGFPESHSASFALIAYASAYLKLHHPAAFLAALLNTWPMGFYHPATLIKDAQRHGVLVKPADVTVSDWRCTLEDARTVRLGLRYVNGLKVASAERLVAERPFSSLADLERRCRLSNAELATLAELGAFAPFGHSRRQALWQVSRLRERTEGLLGRINPEPGESPLPEMDALDQVVADYRTSEVTVGPHPICFLRSELERQGVLSARALARVRHGQRARTAGLVTVSQRPRTAKGFYFITLEDETGFANIIVTPPQFEIYRPLLLRAAGLQIAGVVQNQEGVVHLKADAMEALRVAPAQLARRFG